MGRIEFCSMAASITVLRVATIAAFLASLLGGVAIAACGQGKTPNWDDVEAVRYVRSNCFGKCPNYEVLFWGSGFYYVARGYVDKRGTYEARYDAAVFARVVEQLRAHDFFALNYDRHTLATDVPHLMLSVQRCGVTTRLDWPWHGDRKDIPALFDALDKVTELVPWHKTSNGFESPEGLEASIP